MMIKEIPPVYFYIPQNKLPTDKIPPNGDYFWKWQCSQHSISPMQSGGFLWTLQTYLYLNNYGFPCKLVNTLPDEGIILSHRDFLSEDTKPNAKQLFVCLRADVDRHPYSQLHIVQNPYQAIRKKFLTLWESHFIPHWPQPSIIPRNPNRGDKFENVTFIGNEINLVSEFQDQSWHDQLKELGLKFQKKLNHDEWNNYSDIDVILAIRGFGYDNEYRGKPGSKLYNAWHAGIPAILGYESAFRYERKSDLDYIEASSYQDVIASLKNLKNDRELRRAIIKNGWERAKETQQDKMIERWKLFIVDVAVPAYRRWCSSPRWQQKLFFIAREVFFASRPMFYYFQHQVYRLRK